MEDRIIRIALNQNIPASEKDCENNEDKKQARNEFLLDVMNDISRQDFNLVTEDEYLEALDCIFVGDERMEDRIIRIALNQNIPASEKDCELYNCLEDITAYILAKPKYQMVA